MTEQKTTYKTLPNIDLSEGLTAPSGAEGAEHIAVPDHLAQTHTFVRRTPSASASTPEEK